MTPVPLRWPGHPQAPAPLLAALRLRWRGQRVVLLDDAGEKVHLGAAGCLREAVRLCWFRGLDLLLSAIACTAPRRSPDAARRQARGGGPVVIVLPVLPDLSHTFVYREVLALLRLRPQWRVVVLERNHTAPVHKEAAELLQLATFLPRDGITRAAWRKLRWLFTARGRALFGLYRSQPGGSVRDLLGKNPLREGRHPGNAFRLADLLESWQPNALHVYGSTYSANVAMGASLLLAVPFSITSYVDFEFAYAHKLLAEKLARAAWFRVCTACCRVRLLAIPGMPSARVPVIHFGLDLEHWQQRAAVAGNGVLFSAARLVPKKGLRFVPPALQALAAQGLPCSWRIAGDGPELEPLRQLVQAHGVQDRVVFLGALDNTAVRQEMLAADVALLPCIETADGERDGIPIFLTEAMALGVPAVTTPVGGIPELVRHGDTGFLATPGDAKALAAVLAEVLRDPARARAVGARGREEVHATQDVERSAAQLLALIEDEAA